MTKLTIDTRVALNDSVMMPLFGFGTYQISSGGRCERAVTHALRFGYRHIDTAALYNNEDDVGRALRNSGIARKDIFVVTKLWNDDQGYDSTLRAFDRSLKRLGLESIDQYLLHWPQPGKRLQSWRALIELKKQGRCRSIGVSNFTSKHLDELIDTLGVAPSVNQVEYSPFLHQRELQRYCASKNIRLVAYCPLTRGEKLKHPLLGAIARKHGKSAAQVLLRWALQHGIAVIPKSARDERIEENADLFDFELDAADLDQLDRLNENLRTCWDPTRVR